MFWNHRKELIQLVNSFQTLITGEKLESVLADVEYNEPGLALECLSSLIYELDVTVSVSQETEILRLSKHYGVDENYHKFIGRNPPYPDLRTEEQKALNLKFSEDLAEASIENIKILATGGQMIEAVRMHRQLFGSTLAEAVEKVGELAKSN
jgi:hypothetical protein